MNILFVMDRWVDRGSIQAAANYVRAGEELGHTIALYGREDPRFPGIRFSTDLHAFDYVVFIIESGLRWMSGLRMPGILNTVPRERRVVFDADGMYNQMIAVDGYDRNHRDESGRAEWLAYYDLIADKILQPTVEPQEPRVVPLPFYGYDPTSQLGAAPVKRFDIVHVGHNWWRWREVSSCLLPAIERIRPLLGNICFVGSWWDAVPAVHDPDLEGAFCVDPERLRRLGIQTRAAVPYTEVVCAMSQGRVNIMTQRPLFRRLKLFTSKYFEAFCADTIPLVMLDPDHAESVYGSAGRELALNGGISDRLLDVLRHPERYQQIVQEVRKHLAIHHSYRVRMQQLVVALQAGRPLARARGQLIL